MAVDSASAAVRVVEGLDGGDDRTRRDGGDEDLPEVPAERERGAGRGGAGRGS